MRFQLLVLSGLLLVGCGGDRSRRDRPADQTEPQTKTPTVGQVHLFLETSASMGGYLRGNTDFKNIVAEVATKANLIHPVTVWTITGKPAKYPGDVAAFVRGMATTPLANGKSSELHNVFRQVGERARNNDIALLVSDCILSFPDAEIRRNPEINRENAQSVLKPDIISAFSAFSQQGLGVVVYAFTSPFNGTYYDYRNGKHALTGESRPFYIWVIGKQNLLTDFTRQLRERLSAKPAKQQTFGAVGAVNTVNMLYSLNRKGEWRAGRGGISELRARPQNPAEFAVGVDLAQLPDYAQNPAFLKENLVVTAPNATVKLVNVQRRASLTDTDRLKPAEQKLLSSSSHVLTFRVETLLDDRVSMAVKLPARADTWYADWSTMDDTKPATRRNKTFALVHLMDGVREAYQNNANNFVQFALTLEK